MPARDPSCSVSGCSRPTDGVLTVATPQGSVRFSACADHGRRASDGEWFTYTLLGCTYVLGAHGEDLPPTHFEPLQL